jgi:ribose transport system ATP-binding protein
LVSVPDIRRLSFQLRRGEILGIGGLPDSGKDELASALFGLKPRQGEVKIDGRLVPPESTRHAIRGGMALIPADRRGAGALLSMSVAENVVSASLPKFSLLGFQRRGAIRREARAQVARLDARISHLGQRLSTLSGGNQQKIILSRGLVTNPDILILHEPTRGIDVGAKGEIYGILKGIAQEGVGILMISSELPELVLHCARVLVMRDGMIAGEMAGSDITEEAILACALAS